MLNVAMSILCNRDFVIPAALRPSVVYTRLSRVLGLPHHFLSDDVQTRLDGTVFSFSMSRSSFSFSSLFFYIYKYLRCPERGERERAESRFRARVYTTFEECTASKEAKHRHGRISVQ